MARILVCYYSRTRHTQHMADAVGQGVGKVAGCEVDVRPVEEIPVSALAEYDGLILGSPTYYGTMAAEVKRLLDESVSVHGRLAGKVGGAFASSTNPGGGNESAVLDMLKGLLVHGMVVQGTAAGDHFGPVAVGEVDDRVKAACHGLGMRVASLAKKLREG